MTIVDFGLGTATDEASEIAVSGNARDAVTLTNCSDASNLYLLWGDSVSPAEYAFKVLPGQSVTVDADETVELWVVADDEATCAYVWTEWAS